MRSLSLSSPWKRSVALAVIFLTMGLPARAVRRVTGDQLEQDLTVLRGQPDATVAHQIFDMDATEQLSAERLLRCQNLAPGKLSRQALLALFDKSLFLDPSPPETPSDAPPDHAAQANMITLTVAYVTKTVHQSSKLLRYARHDQLSGQSLV